MSKYVVKLIPTGRFFFGGDMTFSVGKTEHDEKFSSYIIRSMKFPQQTSLLGMLRFLLLSDDDEAFDTDSWKIKDTTKAGNLIGKRSFTVNEPNHEQNIFGKIKKVGTCFLCKDNEYYYQAPFDYSWEVGAFEKATARLNGKEVAIPSILNGENEYSSKDEVNSCYLSSSAIVLKEEDVFKEDSRIGIRKGANGKTEEEAFYKQIGYRLKDDYCFAFHVDVDEVDLTAYSGQLVSVGADSSMFVIQIVEGSFEVDLPASYKKKGNGWEKVILLADTYLSRTEEIKYAISRTKPFRFISTTVENESYHILHNLHNRSKRYSLYTAGSVLFVKDAAKFKLDIEANKEFVQIGYNHCK